MNAITLLCCLLIPIAIGAIIPPNDPNIKYTGRVTSTYSFEWSGVEIGAGFTGTSVAAVFKESSAGNMYNVFVDGTLVLWLNTTSGTKTYAVSKGLKNGDHVIQITKRTEAYFGEATFGGFVLDDGAKLAPYKVPERKIEFIGDSITCGFGNLGHYPCDFTAATEDNFLSYGPMTARALDAELHLEAWSGMGMVRNVNDKNSTSKTPFPALFPYTLPTYPLDEWDFSKWVPQAVVINLGTNDYSTQPAPPADIYETAYQNFIHLYGKIYSPAPKFFLVCGPMQASSSCPYVQNVAKATGAIYIDLEGILSFPADYGCDGHPAVTGHEKMANHTVAAIKSALGW